MEQYRGLVAELEALLPAQLSRKQQQQEEDGEGGASVALAALPVVLHNLHDFFNHVAARLEKLHDGVAAAKDAFLERRREVRAAASYCRPTRTSR
jgi:nucleoporin p58/p45